MKRYLELTHEEALEVSNDEQALKKYIDIEMMVNGIPVIEEPKLELEKIEPDLTVYGFCSLWWLDRDIAFHFYESIFVSGVMRIDNNYSIDSNKYYCKPYPETGYPRPEFDCRKVFSTEHYERSKEVILKNKEKTKIYDELLLDYKANKSKRDELLTNFTRFFSFHRELSDAIDKHDRVFKRYLEIAEGNEEIARKFFDSNEINSFKVQKYDIHAVLNNLTTKEKFVLNLLGKEENE